jgi:hypothetical protein
MESTYTEIINHIRIEINHGNQNVFLSFHMGWRILVNFIGQSMLKLKLLKLMESTYTEIINFIIYHCVQYKLANFSNDYVS